MNKFITSFLLLLSFTISLYAEPTWMGVYGEYKRKSPENAIYYGDDVTFTILQNQNYSGLHAELGWKLNGTDYSSAMNFIQEVDNNSLWRVTKKFSPGSYQFWFKGYDDWTYTRYDNNSNNNYSFQVKDLPVSSSLTSPIASHNSINLSWSHPSSHTTVIVVARKGSAPVDLVQGTAYSVNDVLGTNEGVVVYKGTNETFTHSGLDESSGYYFKIFTVNNNYYSSAATLNVSTTAAPSASVSAATNPVALSEENLNSSQITLSLSDETFSATLDKNNYVLNNAPAGTSIQSIVRNSDTEAVLTLSFDGTDFDSEINNFSVLVMASDLTGSTNLTTQNITISATIDAENLTSEWHTTPGTNGVEKSMDSEVIRLSISGGGFNSANVNTTNITATGTATSSGVSIESVSYVNTTTVDVALAWDGTDYDTDKTLSINVSGNAYNDGSTSLTTDINLPATDEPKYQIYLAETNKSVYDELTFIFEDEHPVNDFFTNGQDKLYMHIGLDIQGSSEWENVQTFSRDGDGNVDEAASTKVVLSKVSDGKYSATIDPIEFFSRIASGSQVNGLKIAVFNKYSDAANNKTDDLYIDLIDALYRTVYLSPEVPTDNESVTVTFNAKSTPLEGAAKVYFHSGIGTDKPASKAFHNAVGNWGSDDGVGEMTKKAGETDIWEITLSNIESYYSLSDSQDAFVLNCLFRSADGNTKEDGASGGNYHLDLNPGNYFLIDKPLYSPFITESNVNFDVEATANTSASWTLVETDKNGNNPGSTINPSVSNSSFTYQHSVSDVNTHYYKLTADFGSGDVKFKTFSVTGYSSVVEESRPAGTVSGINYHDGDDTKVTLVLHTPTSTTFKKGTGAVTGTNSTASKNVVHLLWEGSSWGISDIYKLKKDGDYWWITLDNLTAGEEYVFQYLVDGQTKIADPYTRKVSESNDQWISNSTYPGLISYPADKTSEIASVFQTAKPQYSWQVTDFNRPASNKLNIYELHFRDFTTEGTYKAATAKLDYIEELGINCIHVMPVSEFEGNDSWGYNPNFYFAADKAYGTENDLKEFIDEAHKRGIAVVNDLVLNHAFHSNVMARLYWNSTDNKPANDNPWFNPDHKAVYDQAGHWGADWNHESEHTQNMIDDILNYWISEFKFDGFRFDFTKGFTQTAPDGGDPWASSYDQDRVDLLKRMVNKMWENHPGTYAIFEHLANDDEDKALADHGILMWSGAGPQKPYKNLALGYTDSGEYSIWGSVYKSRNFTYSNYISYIESHDEERLGHYVSQYAKGISGLSGDAKTEFLIKRLKGISAFNAFLPGPRMIWQFEELGYDVSIDYNGRTGKKPIHWEYYDDAYRKQLYRLYSLIFNLRNTHNLYATDPDWGNIGWTDLNTPRRMSLYDGNGKKVILIANFDSENSHNVTPGYSGTGTWYKYNGDPAVDGTTFNVSDVNSGYLLAPSEVFILTNFDAKKRNQTVSFDNITNKTYGDATFTVSATSSSGLPVTYEVVNGNATINGNQLTITGAGAVEVKAKQVGAEYYYAAESTQIFNVNKASQTITFGNLANKTYGDASFDLTASTDAIGLTVIYESSNTDVATVTGSTVTIVGVGTTTITAKQAGDANYNAASDVAQSLTIEKADQTITFGILANKTYGDANFDLTASTDATGLTVVYESSNTDVATVSGNTITMVGAGTTTITAKQAGDANYNAASDVAQLLTVEKADQTITFGSLANKTYGDANFDLTASTNATGLTVVYESSNTDVATVSGNTVTIVGVGTTTITAKQAGGANYNAASDIAQSLTIEKADQTITFGALANKTYGDANFDLTASTDVTGLTVTYVSSNTDVATVSGNTVTIVGVGTTTITAKQAGNANYNAASDVSQSLTIEKADQTISFGSLADKTYGDANFDLTATTDATGLTVVYESSNSDVATVSGSIVTIVGVGTTTITAKQAGNVNYNAASGVAQSLTVGKADQTITFGALANKTYGDANFDLTASTDAAGLTVTYESSNTNVATVSGSTVTIVAAGTTTITAKQAGDANYNAASDVAQSLTVEKSDQTITFGTLANKTYGDANFDLTASTDAVGLAVTYESSNTDVATISGSTVTIVGAGSTTITAKQAGDANYNVASDVAQLLTVEKVDQTITFETLANKTYGDANFDLTASTDATGLTVVYESSNTDVATVSGSTVTIVGAGTTTIIAKQAGEANYNAASDVAQSLTVDKVDQTITFGAFANKTYGDSNFDLTATTDATGLTVVYESSNTDVATVSGSTVTIVGAGSTTITAKQAGDANYNAASDVAQSLTVDKADQTITFGALANKTFGDENFDLTAITNATGLTVTYESSNTDVATVSGSTVTIVAAGTTTIIAKQAGDANYNAALDVAQSLIIEKADQTITFGALANKTYGDANFDLTASTDATGLTVIYESSNSDVATVSGSTVTIVGAGTTTITAKQEGNANYNAASDVAQSFTVEKDSQTITFGALSNKTYEDANFDLTASTDATGLTVVYESSNTNVATVSGGTVTIVAAGTTTITAKQEGNANYNAASDVLQSLTIEKADQTITFGTLENKTYGDANFDLTASTDATSLTVVYESSNTDVATVSGNTITMVGAGTTSITAKQAGDANYNSASDVTQSLTVEKADQTITFGTLTNKTYGDANFDLTASTDASGLTVTYESSNTDVATVSGSTVTIVGAGTTTITAKQVGNANYNAASDVAQSLTVEKADQAITFGALSNKTYGDANFELTASTDATGLTVTYISSNTDVATISGSTVTIVGAGTTIITAKQAGEANYNVASDVAQSLTVDKVDQTITFGAFANKTYGDSNFDLTATTDATGLTVVYESSNTDVATVSGSTVTIVGVGTTTITAKQAGGANYNAASDVAQSLTIEKADQTITFGILANKTYGDANFDLTASTDATGLTVTYVSSNTDVATISGSTVTIVGAGTTTITAKHAGDENYNAASDVAQTLTVEKASQTITFGTLANKTFGDANFDLTASTDATGLTVVYESSNTDVATVSGNTVTIVGVGTTTIMAKQAGNANYNAASDVAQSLTVEKADQIITFGALANKTYGDANFDLTATTDATGLTVVYESSNSDVATVSGSTVTIVGAGTTTITAKQAGDANYNAASDVAQSLTVEKADQTITFGALVNKTYGDANFDLTAITDATGLTVVYESSNSDVATVSGSTVTIVGVGTTTITAKQTGDANYNASSDVAQLLTVEKADQTITFRSLANKTYGDANFDLTASTDATGLTVVYESSNTDVATVSGSTVTIVGVGTTTITAKQAGDANYNASSDVTQSLTIEKADQTITFGTLANKTYGDANFDLTASTDATGLTVIYESSNTDVATVSGSTVTIVGAGTTTITAKQAGDVNYNAASDVAQLLTVEKADQTITFGALANKTYGDASFNLTASTDATGLTVTYVSSNTDVATVSGSTVTVVGAGTTTITAKQAGDANYNAASDVVQDLIIEKAEQTISFGALEDRTLGDSDFDLSASSTSGLEIDFKSSNSAVATVSGNTVTIVGAGITTITAKQAGNKNYHAAIIEQKLTVNKPTGVTDKNNIDIKLYPNPVIDKLKISFNREVGSIIKIVDGLGKLVYKSEITQEYFEYELAHLPSGIYFVLIEIEGKLKSWRIVKL